MMSLRAGDVGVAIEITILNDGGIMAINTASTKEIVFVSPTLVRVVKTAAFVTDGKDGRISYPTLAADFTEVGKWTMQAHIVMPGKDLRSSEETLDVRRAL